MNYCDPLYEDVEALASQKAFGELTPDERTTVLRVLGSADAYTSLRSMVRKVRSEFASDFPQLEPRPASQASLRLVVEGRARQNRSIPFTDRCKAAMNRRIPLSYSAAAVVAAIAATLLLYRPAEQPVPVQQIVYVDRPVEVQRAVVDETRAVQPVVDSVVRKAIARTPKATETRSLAAVIRDTARKAVAVVVDNVSATLPGSPRNEYIGLGNLQQISRQIKGRTLAEDSSLSRFVRPLSDDTL